MAVHARESDKDSSRDIVLARLMPETVVDLRRMLEQPNDIPEHFELSRVNGEPTHYFPCEEHTRGLLQLCFRKYTNLVLSHWTRELKYDPHDLCPRPKRCIGVRSIFALMVSEIGGFVLLLG
jgi:hypothetical protein